jgi:hypothetical protein
MNIIDIDYNTLIIVIIALFALSGYLRGWWREGITTVFLVLLVIFLTQPELAQRIIEFINSLIKMLSIVVQTRGSFEASAISAAAETPPPIVLDPNDRSLYVIILVVMVLLAYFTSRITLGNRTISFGARIFGGILGAVNGFIVVNLVKEFIVGRFFPGTGVSAQAAAPSTLSVSISDVPPGSVFTDAPLLLIIGIGVVVVALILANRLTRTGRRVPWGYEREYVIKTEAKK